MLDKGWETQVCELSLESKERKFSNLLGNYWRSRAYSRAF